MGNLGIGQGRGLLFSKMVKGGALVAEVDPGRLSCYPKKEGDVKQCERRLKWRLLVPSKMEGNLQVGATQYIFSVSKLFLCLLCSFFLVLWWWWLQEDVGGLAGSVGLLGSNTNLDVV